MASTPSGASQRLLTMKFMQRAAAAGSPTSPGVSQSEDERPSKRAKIESRSSLGSPQTHSPLFDQGAARAAKAALEAEAQKRAALIEQQAEKLGDAHWRLDPAKLPGSDQRKGALLNIVQVGFSQIDEREALETEQAQTDGPSFQLYGPRRSKKTKVTKGDDGLSRSSDSDTDSDSDSDSDSESDSSDSSSEGSNEAESLNKPGRASYGTQKRQELNSRKTVEREKAKKLAEKRRGKDVRLNSLTSISGAGSSGFSTKGSGRRR